MTTTTRRDWVDIAKGLGIILVIYGHVARGLFYAYVVWSLLQGLLEVVMSNHTNGNNLAFELTIIIIISILLPILFVKISRSLNFNFLFKPPAVLSVEKFSNKAG